MSPRASAERPAAETMKSSELARRMGVTPGGPGGWDEYDRFIKQDVRPLLPGVGAYKAFGTYRLGAGKTVTVHTGSGSNTARHRYWRQDWYVWNNDGDRARLKKPNGTTVDSCSYSGAGSSVAC
jgi:Lamin Tail Domain